MQRSAGVDEMSTVTLMNLICPTSCENSSLFRQGVLLPKIKFTSLNAIKNLSIYNVSGILVEQIPLKTDTRDTVLPASRYEIITRTLLKRHSSRHAA